MADENVPRRDKVDHDEADGSVAAGAEFIKHLIDDNSLEQLQKIELAIKLSGMGLNPAVRGESSEQGLDYTKFKVEEARHKLEQSREAARESYKLRFEAYRSQNILCSGAVVAFAAITAALISNPQRLWLLTLAYFLILLSIVSTAAVMHYLSLKIMEALMPGHEETVGRKLERTYTGLIYFASWAGFSGGLLAFLVFVNLNL